MSTPIYSCFICSLQDQYDLRFELTFLLLQYHEDLFHL